MYELIHLWNMKYVILLLEGLKHDLYKDLWANASKTNQILRFSDVRLYTDGEIFVECKLGQSIFYLYFIIMHGLKVIF